MDDWMFKKGKQYQQKTIYDFDQNMSKARMKILKNSWAYDFLECFPCY